MSKLGRDTVVTFVVLAAGAAWWTSRQVEEHDSRRCLDVRRNCSVEEVARDMWSSDPDAWGRKLAAEQTERDKWQAKPAIKQCSTLYYEKGSNAIRQCLVERYHWREEDAGREATAEWARREQR